MTREIIINAARNQSCIAILEDGELVEIYMESPENIRTIGDIYLGRVRKIMPSIQAAFVDIGQKQDAFLHFSDVSDNLPELLEFVRNPKPIGGEPKRAQPEEASDAEDETAKEGQEQRKRSGRGRKRGGRRGGRQRGNKQQAGDSQQTAATNGSPSSDSDKQEDADDKGGGKSRRQGSRSGGRQKSQPGEEAADGGNDDARKSESDSEQKSEEKTGSSSKRSSRGRGGSGRGRRSSSRKKSGDGGGGNDDANRSQRGDGRSGGKGDGGSDKSVSFAAETESDTEEKLIDGPAIDPVEHLQRDQKILVQITKEPISNKGSRITSGVTLAGRFMVLVPKASYVAVSKKIYSTKERRRLRTLSRSLLPDGFGVIVRTVAEGKNAKALDTDLRLLLEKWRKIEEKLMQKPDPPCVIYQDVSMASSVIRDLFTDDYDRILVDEPRLYRNIKSYIQAVAPQMVSAVKLYEETKPVFEKIGIAKDVAGIFESRVDMPSGGYLFIEKTEAMYVIDVNSGRSGRGRTQEENSLKINLEAARFLAKHLRLRDIGGIIVVDFIDLRDDSNRRKVFDELRKAFRKDRAVTKVLPMSDFGLVQITRQRLRPSVAHGTVPALVQDLEVEETDYSIPGPDEVVKAMERWLVLHAEYEKKRTATLVVHPFVAAYLTRGVPNYTMRWFMRYFIRVRLDTDDQMDPLAFKFLDSESGEDITDRYDYNGVSKGE